MSDWLCDKCKKQIDRTALTEMLGWGLFICTPCIDEFIKPKETPMNFEPELPQSKVISTDSRTQQMIRMLLAALDGFYEETTNSRIGSDEWVTYRILIDNLSKALETKNILKKPANEVICK